MNERIKELAKQSLCIKGGEFSFNGGEVELVDLEQFALLIVRECGVALSPMLRDMVSRGQAFDLIKRHFGVEE